MVNARRTLARGRKLSSAAFAVLAACAGQPASACGFHDQVQLQRGVMNWVYPESLHVGTAVWKAQLAGRLVRDELANRDDLTPEARNRMGYVKASSVLGQLRLALAAVRRSEPQPRLAVVLLGPMLWSRYEEQGDDVRLQVHVDGPAQGDVVVVTEAPAIEALASGRLLLPEAVALGVIRLYASAPDSRRALEWLSAISRTRADVR